MKRLSTQYRVMLAAVIALALGGTACASGEAVFAANCAVCHQSDGQGVQGIYPALADTVGRYVESSAGRAYLVHVVAFGMTGAIESRGTAYNGFMQPWTRLSDAQIAAVLNYILSGFNAKILPAGFKPYTAAEVKGLRAASKSFDQVHAERAAIVKSAGQSAMLPPAERAH